MEGPLEALPFEHDPEPSLLVRSPAFSQFEPAVVPCMMTWRRAPSGTRPPLSIPGTRAARGWCASSPKRANGPHASPLGLRCPDPHRSRGCRQCRSPFQGAPQIAQSGDTSGAGIDPAGDRRWALGFGEKVHTVDADRR